MSVPDEEEEEEADKGDCGDAKADAAEDTGKLASFCHTS